MLAVLVTTALVAALRWDKSAGVSIVGAVPQGLPTLAFPPVAASAIGQLWLPALLISLVGFVESVSVAQSLALKRQQRIQPNRELLAELKPDRILISPLAAPLAARVATPVIPAGRLPSMGLRAQLLWTARVRVLWLLGGFALIALIALLRIASLGLAGQAPQRTSLEDALLPPRGEITDRNGAPLARAFPAYALWFEPKAMGDSGAPLVRSPAEVARDLKAIFPDIDEARAGAGAVRPKPPFGEHHRIGGFEDFGRWHRGCRNRVIGMVEAIRLRIATQPAAGQPTHQTFDKVHALVTHRHPVADHALHHIGCEAFVSDFFQLVEIDLMHFGQIGQPHQAADLFGGRIDFNVEFHG